MRPPQAIFFDFDGVILESLDVKAAAMAALFADRPEHVAAIVRYHLEHPGVSRYDKFRHYFAEYFREPLTDAVMAQLDRRFSELVWEGAIRCPFVPGAEEFLSSWGDRLPLFTVSAAPQDEVERIVRARGLQPRFRSVSGSPKSKKAHLERLLAEHSLEPARCLFVGDAQADFDAASFHGIPFVQRLTHVCRKPLRAGDVSPIAVLEDLKGLERLWTERTEFANRRAPVLLAHAGESPLTARSLKGGAWVYLGRDVSALKRWERGLGPAFERLDISEPLQDVAARLRKPYLDYLSALARRYSSLEWWTSRISDENTLSASPFNDVCYLRTALDLLAGSRPPALIVAESQDLLEALAASAAHRRSDLFWKARHFSRLGVLFLGRWTLYFSRALGALWDARTTRGTAPRLPDTGGRPLVLMHACIDSGYFTEPAPRDIYFTVLPEELRRRGYAVVALPWLFNPGRPRRKAFRWFRERRGHYLIPEDFYRLSDYVWAARTLFRQRRLPDLPQMFESMDITPLIRGHRREQAMNTSAAPFILYTRLFERLARAGFKPEIFIDFFENSLTEKPIVMAIRRFLPGTRTVGFQHWAAPPPLMLQHFAVPNPDISPLPDSIVCNSPFTRGLYAKEGFPESMLRVGPSLRYRYLLEAPSRAAAEPRTVLVGLSLDLSSTEELLSTLREAFPRDEGLIFQIKTHPQMSEAQWATCLGRGSLPAHMRRVSGGMREWSARAACAVVGASTMAMELAMAGIPLVLAGRETTLDFNPLAHFPEFAPPVRTAAALRTSVLKAVALPEDEKEKLAAWASWARAECLSPINDETISAFLEPANEVSPT